MKKNLYVKAMSLAVVAATSFAVVACDSDTLSGPDFNSGNGGKSSAVEQPAPQSSSSEVVESSSAKSESSSSVKLNISSSSFSQKPLSSSSVETCPNGRWTTHCNGIWAQEPVCCEEKLEETCRHISDYDGMTAQGNCVNQNGRTAVDCVTGENYECKNNNWQPVACMDIKPTECKPGMVGCDYRLCQPDGVQEIADCESGAIYVCNGEMWEIKKTEENQHCARGELEYCAACFEEGAFNGHYKCVQGKWLKMGMGDEICEHITDFRCAEGKTRCSIACDENLQKRTQDCKTGEMYVCQSGLWTLELRDCDSDADGCGREILQPTCDAQNGGNCALPLMDYERCARGEKEFCNSNNSWLSESCEESELSRDLRIEMQDGSYRSENYICVKGRWVERYKYYECGEKESCVTASVRCPSLGVEGTACSENGSSKVVDSCAFTCSNGVYKYTPAPL